MNQKLLIAEPGEWGTQGAGLVIEKNSVKIEYACATGEIEQPLRTDENGIFNVEGTHTRLSPGPIRLDFPPKSQPAIYEGRITGKIMSLKVTLKDSKEVIGEFTFEQGKQPRIRRCL